MSKLTLNDVTNIGSITVINDNFDKIKQELQTKVLYRNNPSGEPNMMENDIDMNGKSILNVGDVFSSVGRWATIDEVEDIRDEVATNAATVATNKDIAVSSATSAALSYDNFDDRYLGQKASDPSVDNDGGLLLTGALYFRTSGTPIMRVYNGTTWQDVGSITTTTTNLIDPTLYSSQAEAEAGLNNTKVITPLRAKNAIDAQVKGGFTSTGPIILPGNAATALAAVPKQQAETIASDAASSAVSDRSRILLLPAQATTSGTFVDFTSIPSWAKKITVQLAGVSCAGNGFVGVRLGTGATPVFATSGYQGCAWQGPNFTNFTDIMAVSSQGLNVDIRHGTLTLTKVTGNIWAASSVVSVSNAPSVGGSAFTVTLGDVLTAVRLTTHNGDTFDAGSVSLLVEG